MKNEYNDAFEATREQLTYAKAKKVKSPTFKNL